MVILNEDNECIPVKVFGQSLVNICPLNEIESLVSKNVQVTTNIPPPTVDPTLRELKIMDKNLFRN